ncbi:MAG: cell division protein [Archaeoglobus sp.]|nr:MAG: cell division protein [Archaeoglobus sp.]
MGSGTRGSLIADWIAKKGARVNRVKLFKCYAIANEIEVLTNLKGIPEKDRFHIAVPRAGADVGGIVNSIMEKPEIFEGSLIISTLNDDFSYFLGMELAEKIRECMEDPIIGLTTLTIGGEIAEIRRRIKEFRRKVDILVLFQEDENIEEKIVKSMNLISLVGEVDIKKGRTGEVVVDTSDVFNSLMKSGISAIGYASRKLPHPVLKRLFMRKKYHIKGVRAQRMVDMLKEAHENLSIGIDEKSAKSALFVFSGDPEEITMDGIFSCISILESLSPEMEIRYGDYPCKTRDFSVVLLYSGVTRLRF